MKAEDTVLGTAQDAVWDWEKFKLDQAMASIKAVREELKKQIEIKKANAFSVSLFGDSNHQLKMDAMVSAYDVVLNLIKEETNGDN